MHDPAPAAAWQCRCVIVGGAVSAWAWLARQPRLGGELGPSCISRRRAACIGRRRRRRLDGDGGCGRELLGVNEIDGHLRIAWTRDIGGVVIDAARMASLDQDEVLNMTI